MSTPFQTPSSKQYRVSSQLDSVTQTAKRKLFEESAQTYSQQNHVSMDQAYRVFIDDYDEWKDVEIVDVDIQVGTILHAAKLQVCCNSRLNHQLYNDTIAIHLCKKCKKCKNNINEPGMKGVIEENEENEIKYVTYRKKVDGSLTHSGDQQIDYGLRHTIKLENREYENNENKIYIISSPWWNGHAANVAELDKTEPILEIRVEDRNGLKKRYVLPQDYTQGFRHTACVNAVLTYKNKNDENDEEEKGERWQVTIRRDFIHGFADEPETLIENVQNILK